MKAQRSWTVGRLFGVAVPPLALLYWRGFRPWSNHWGVTEDDVSRPLPGDEIVPEPAVQATQGVAIDAPPEYVWPWLVQMGPGRGGAYTYDWIENLNGLNMHSADRIVPEWQHMDVGDEFVLNPNGPRLRVEALVPRRSLVLAYPDGSWSWSFALVPLDGDRTHLITRNRAPANRWQSRLRWEVMSPGAFLMMRKMLLGIKERAERLASEAERETTDRFITNAPDLHAVST